ncbi:MAG: hypothetical protein V4581_14970 [Bacteroidota bacterium]
MKKLHITFVALFMLVAVQAQTAAEKAVLGKWNIASVTTDGVTFDMNTGDMTFSDEVVKEIKAEGVSLEGAKKMLKPQMSEYKDMSLTINANGTMKMFIFKTTFDDTYKLVEKDGKKWFIGGGGAETEYILTDNMLVLMVNKRDTIIQMSFKKE